ncbi:hypothetical protein [Propionimicrobium lymphophilum]|uniref:hypothetical protein n=1 Tax=Propionimicrobium lymphophilum TaxID=33012 RepID=UPI0012DBDC31|nr:hypothetical protein [Propionimicrobium lymphophilum]
MYKLDHLALPESLKTVLQAPLTKNDDSLAAGKSDMKERDSEALCQVKKRDRSQRLA